ncbi:hypothetical protein RMCBS344292_13782 [Rhizopus microsporus]|nr:hypothetical protein RMCBS344292_13782 [Rhizopus microsporus]
MDSDIPSAFANRPAGDKAWLVFHYIPNQPLSIVSLVVYIIFMLYFAYRVYKTKSRRFLYILAFTAFMEVVGYLIRAMCYSFTSIARFAVMNLFLLLAPNALALVNYKTLGEMIRLSRVQEKRFYLRPKFVTWFFFASDILSFLMQGSGGGLQATGNADTGKAIVLVGLFIQLFFLACFFFITIYVSRNDNYTFYVAGVDNPKRKLAICLFSTLVLIYIRSIYRVIEYATGYDGPVARTEWAFYVFDTLAIAICFVLYGVYYIGNYIPKRDAQEDVTATSSIDLNTVRMLKNPV